MSQIDKRYHELLEDILISGRETDDRTGTGTKSVFGRQIRHDMRTGFPLLTTKKLHTRSIIHELLWFLKGGTNIKYLNDNNVTIWDEWADDNGDLGPVYGQQWVNLGGFKEHYLDSKKNEKGYLNINTREIKGINQIQNCIDLLKNDPDSRRIIVNAWNVQKLKDMALPPCHYVFQFKTYEMTYEERCKYWCKNNNKSYPWFTQKLDNNSLDKLGCPKRYISLMWNQRSVDTFLGLPFNIASYALLLEMFAQQVNMVPLELIGILGDTHLYSNHLEYVEEQLKRNTNKYPSPNLKLNKADDIFSYKFEDFEIVDYESYPNWKNVPIAV